MAAVRRDTGLRANVAAAYACADAAFLLRGTEEAGIPWMAQRGEAARIDLRPLMDPLLSMDGVRELRGLLIVLCRGRLHPRVLDTVMAEAGNPAQRDFHVLFLGLDPEDQREAEEWDWNDEPFSECRAPDGFAFDFDAASSLRESFGWSAHEHLDFETHLQAVRQKTASSAQERSMTRRTHPEAPGRLFPSEEFGGGWSLSAQGDAVGYRCRPAARLDSLESYEAVEVVLYSPDGLLDPSAIGLPEDVAAKFGVGRAGGEVEWQVGSFLTQDDLNAVRLRMAELAGAPRAPAPRLPCASLPTPDGLFLWEIRYEAVRHDSDPRCPGDVPVTERLLFLAKTHPEAMEAAGSFLDKVRRKNHRNAQVFCVPAALDNLFPARDASKDGRMGWFSTSAAAKIELSEGSEWRLAVCLVPKEA